MRLLGVDITGDVICAVEEVLELTFAPKRPDRRRAWETEGPKDAKV